MTISQHDLMQTAGDFQLLGLGGDWVLRRSADQFWPTPDVIAEEKLSLDAFCFAAAKHQNSRAARMYLSAGADPLVRTTDGDCAARVGIANGMAVFFARPEWLDAAHDTIKETGLFMLARERKIDAVKKAYKMGADPDIRNGMGYSVLDVVDSTYRREVEAAIVEARARKLSDATVEVKRSRGHAGPAQRRL